MNYHSWRPIDHIIFALGGPLANFMAAIALIALVNVYSLEASAYNLLVAPVLLAFSFSCDMVASIWGLITQPQEVSSVVGLTSVGAQFVEAGFVTSLNFAALLSLNMAIFNAAGVGRSGNHQDANPPGQWSVQPGLDLFKEVYRLVGIAP